MVLSWFPLVSRGLGPPRPIARPLEVAWHSPPHGGCIQGDCLVKLRGGPNYVMGIILWGLLLAKGGWCSIGLGTDSWETRHMGYNQNYTAQHARPTYAHARCPIASPSLSHHDKTKQNGTSKPMSLPPLHISHNS